MFTSQAEYRLLLRCDNAGDRLGETARRLGLLTASEADFLLQEKTATAAIRARLERTVVPAATLDALERSHDLRPGGRRVTWEDLLRRPELTAGVLQAAGLPAPADLMAEAGTFPQADPQRVMSKVEVEVKYAGYLKRMQEEIERSRKLEHRAIPVEVFDCALDGISTEATQKLRSVRPETFGQARRIPGVRTTDLSVLMVHAERVRHGS